MWSLLKLVRRLNLVSGASGGPDLEFNLGYGGVVTHNFKLEGSAQIE